MRCGGKPYSCSDPRSQRPWSRSRPDHTTVIWIITCLDVHVVLARVDALELALQQALRGVRQPRLGLARHDLGADLARLVVACVCVCVGGVKAVEGR